MVKVKEDLTGNIFGRLTVLRQTDDYIRPSGKREAQWICLCSCQEQNLVVVRGSYLRSGHTNSCGCWKQDVASKIHTKTNSYDISGEYGIGYFNNGGEFLFDIEDYEKIKDYCWCNSGGYVVTNQITHTDKKTTLKLYRLIMDAPDYMEVDHINGNPLDNRKANLRLVTHHENSLNQRKPSNNTSGYKGVYWNKSCQKWMASIAKNGKNIYLGLFDNPYEAHLTYEEKAKELFGEFKRSIENY